MKKIYETERYANRTNVDYASLDRLAESLNQHEYECEYSSYILSYARVSTPLQLKGNSLQTQHESNVRDIRAMFDNPIVYITEVGSGTEKYQNRILCDAVSDSPESTAIFYNFPDRLTRSIKEAIPLFEAMKEKKMWGFFHMPNTKELVLFRDYSIINLLKDAPEDATDALTYFTKLMQATMSHS